jgi:hypothetical protein
MPHTEDISEHLPFAADGKGLRLLWKKWHDSDRGLYLIKTILINRNDKLLYYWSYTPSLGEVREITLNLINEGRIEDND